MLSVCICPHTLFMLGLLLLYRVVDLSAVSAFVPTHFLCWDFFYFFTLLLCGFVRRICMCPHTFFYVGNFITLLFCGFVRHAGKQSSEQYSTTFGQFEV